MKKKYCFGILILTIIFYITFINFSVFFPVALNFTEEGEDLKLKNYHLENKKIKEILKDVFIPDQFENLSYYKNWFDIDNKWYAVAIQSSLQCDSEINKKLKYNRNQRKKSKEAMRIC